MTVDDLVIFYDVKNDAELAHKLGGTKGMVSKWRNNGIPYLRQRDFQLQTKGKLKAEIKPEQLAG